MNITTAVILAGGRGTRLSEVTSVTPKPMVTLGPNPIIWHIMKGFDHFGVKRFIICSGYKAYAIKEYFLNYRLHHSNFVVDLQTQKVRILNDETEDWQVHVIDTGIETSTGGRLKRIRELVREEDSFFVTYGDGLADVDLHALGAFHTRRKEDVTVTAVRPPGRFGSLVLEDDMVREFSEKPLGDGGYISGGFFVMRPEALDVIGGDKTSWEYESLPNLVSRGEVNSYRHEGFWHPMDTLRDREELSYLWESNRAPWKVWS